MAKSTVSSAEKLVESAMKGNDASHDAAHVFRVRDLALSLAREEGLSSSPDSMEIVELAALLHDIGIHYSLCCFTKKDSSEGKIVEEFLEAEGVDESKKIKILSIIKGMGFKEEVEGYADSKHSAEFGVVQDADRLDAIGAIGNMIVLLFFSAYTLGLSFSACGGFSPEETLLSCVIENDLSWAGQRRAEKRHKFMEDFLKEFYEEWDGRS
ncbi:hypothetical protein RHGRI_026316 [Rhododendron griersonianum]|uniref:HD/PDEase domain-containing protein n=1 Tax=Rhododendron griersonianum TaxID=479676 RepID=A0AAV6IYJ9_9ERIC|nr:hypothetical protein RHGRI_026316 [Rhododendron griersonianum]